MQIRVNAESAAFYRSETISRFFHSFVQMSRLQEVVEFCLVKCCFMLLEEMCHCVYDIMRIHFLFIFEELGKWST